MNNQEYADHQEAEAQGFYPGHGTVVQVYWEIEYSDGRMQYSGTFDDAIAFVSKACGIPTRYLSVIPIERGLVEVYPAHCKWIGAIATIMELQMEVEI